jgi:uncharacterized protein YoxC
MAKQAIVNVVVKDEQFQQLQKSINDLSKTIQGLTTRFSQISRSINQVNQAAQIVSMTIKGMLNALSSLSSFVRKITTEFAKWAALIGSLVLMLGTGAGLFGIDRLAQSIMQKRRQALGLGTDPSRLQAAQIATATTLGDPSGVISNIQKAQMFTNQRAFRGLRATGISGIEKMDPTDAFIAIIRKAPDILKEAGIDSIEKMGPRLQARALDEIMTPEFWRRYFGPEGRIRSQEDAGRYEKLRGKGLTAEEGKPWADLYTTALQFKQRIETELGKSLSGIAIQLGEVSKSFGDLLTALLESQAVKDIMEMIRTGLDNFAKSLGSDETKKKLEEWAKWIGEINWKGLGEKISTFMGYLEEAIKILFAIKAMEIASGVASVITAMLPGPLGKVLAVLIAAGAGLATYLAVQKFLHPGQSLIPGGDGPGGLLPPGTTMNPALQPGEKWHGFFPGSGLWNPKPDMPIGAPSGGFPSGSFGSLGGGSSQFASVQGGSSMAFNIGGGGAGDGRTMLAWAGVARGRVPGQNARGLGGGLTALARGDIGGAFRDGGFPWSQNRVTNLVVRDVPGSNIHMSMAGMSGNA